MAATAASTSFSSDIVKSGSSIWMFLQPAAASILKLVFSSFPRSYIIFLMSR
jgi:hypothetical protein